MAGTINISSTIQATANDATIAAANSGQYTMAGSNASQIVQQLTTTPAAISVGNCASIGAMAVKVLTGSGSQHVVISRDSGGLQPISDIPEGLAVLLIKPPATLYAAVNTGTIGILITCAEQ